MEKNEQLFYDKLKDIFIGAKIEGKSGFVNLMKIKSSYFDVVFKELKKEIDEKLKEFPDFNEEMYDKLNTFFSTYFSESGSIYFTYTPLKSKIYDKIYTDQDDVILFWKTRMLYYVKTDKIWKDLTVEYDKDGVKYKIYFDVSKLQQKSGNEKKEIIYELNKINANEILYYVYYSKNGGKTDVDNIRKKLKENKIYLNEEDLEKIFKIFEKQNEVDYFINKDAKTFLREQFDLWLKNYVFDDESDFSAKRIKELKNLKEIAYKVIDFVSQFEDELVKIWNKPKFVLNSNYVITLDRIANKNNGMEIIKKILNHEKINEQIKEWQELGIVDDNFKKEEIIQKGLTKNLNPKYKFLPIDTKYFKDLEFDILSLFDNLDKELDGWLIHSENYQALDTILPKFKEKVQTIYIDPPFNTGNDFDYVDRFQSSSWLTLMENRLRISKQFLDKIGSYYLHLDSNADFYGKILLDNIFGKDNFRVKITWKRHTGPKTQSLHFPNISDFILVYSNNEGKWIYNPQYLPYKKGYLEKMYKYEDEKGKYRIHDLYAPGEGLAKIFNGKKIEPPKGHHWSYTQDKIDIMIKEGIIFLDNRGFPKLKVYLGKGEQVTNIWTDINVIQGSSTESLDFQTQKPEKLIERIIRASSSSENDLILDFFLGSGTTIAVSHKLKRKWLGVEMGEHFYTVVLPRMKKVLAYDSSGISKEQDVKEKYNENNAGGFFKYYDLEQYEQTLRKCHYIPSEPFFDLGDKSIYEQYVFLKDPKLLDAMELDYKNNKISIKFDEIYPNIDIVETLSNLKGKWIKKITKDSVVLMDDNGNEEEIKYDGIDFKTIKPLIWW